jgi:hypothetical protein
MENNMQYLKNLNLGCGEVKFKDYLNVDIREDVNPDVCCDISKLSIFESNYFNKIIAHDVLEHFSHLVVWSVLEEWIRVLAVNGELEIQVPSIDRIIASRDEIIRRAGGDSTGRFSKLIFGGQDYPSNFHSVCFTYEFFVLAAKKYGLLITKYNPTVGLFNHSVTLMKLKCN